MAGQIYDVPYVPDIDNLSDAQIRQMGLRVLNTGGYFIVASRIGVTLACYYVFNSTYGDTFNFVTHCKESDAYTMAVWVHANAFSQFINITNTGYDGYYSISINNTEDFDVYGISDLLLNYYDTKEEAFRALSDGGISYPITYRDTNCTHSGPDEAAAGDEVSVTYQFPDGYGIVNPSTDLYVTNNGVLIPSTYADGKLTFTMPEQS